MARRYRRKRHYSTPQRILAHLLAVERTAGGDDAVLTQDGIAAATLSARPTIAKGLAALVRRGWVVRERVRIPAYSLPKYAYRLSAAGWEEAGRLRSRLSTELIEVLSPSLGRLSVRVADVPAVGPPGWDLTTVVASVREGCLDLARPPARGPIPRGFLLWGESLRRVDRLFGRAPELRALDAWSASGGRVLLVTGLPGIGKSALVAGWIAQRRPKAHVFGVQVHRATTVAALLAEFGTFLSALGRRHLATHVAQGDPLDVPLAARLLARDLEGLRILVVLDSAEQASREVARFLRGTIPDVVRATPARFLLVSRRSPAWLAPVPAGMPSVDVLRVRGLDPAASRALLRAAGFASDDALEDVVTATRGHPLLLHLVARRGPRRISAVRRYFGQEVWGSLGAEGRLALEAAAVFPGPVPERILEATSGVRRRTLDDLAAKNLLERTRSGGFLVHDLVRDVVRGRLRGPRARQLHGRAARALLREREPRDRWEGIYHLIAAGRTDEAAAFLDSEGAPLLDSVAAEEIASLVRDLRRDALSPVAACTFAEVLGDSLRIRGHVGPASRQYGHALRRAHARGQEARVPRLLRKMASLERHRNRYERALGLLVEAQGRLSHMRDRGESTEVLRELALVEEALGQLSKAAAHLGEAIDLATEASDWGALSRSLLALGTLDAGRGHRDRGLAYTLEGLRIARRSGNVTEVARAHIVVGTVLADAGRLEESLAHYEEGHALAQRLGNLRLTAYATMDRTASLLNLGRYAETGIILREAQGAFQILEERDTLGLLKTYEGQWEMGMGHWGRALRAWEEGLRDLRAYGKASDLVPVLLEVAGFCAGRGEEEMSRALLQEARGIAGTLGNPALIAEIEDSLARGRGIAGSGRSA